MSNFPLQSILSIGVSSLKAQETGLSVTSHNLANTNTDGYSRQRANLDASFAISITPGQLGTGVVVQSVTRMRDGTLDGNVRQESGQRAKYDTLSKNLTALETLFGDATQNNITTGMQDFFNSWQNLANTPANIGVRQTVVDTATSLTDYLHDAASQMDVLEKGIDGTVTAASTDINSMLNQVATLNKQIVYGEIGGNSANDMRDQRDLLLDKLSEYMDMDTVEGPTGMVNISVNGETLVSGVTSYATQVVSAGAPPHPQVQSMGGVALITNGGKLAAVDQSYQTIDQMHSNLDEMAASLVRETNALATSGSDMNGVAGTAFFDPAGVTAATISVAAPVAADPTKVVAAAAGGAIGNNVVALQMVALQDKAVTYATLPAGTFDGTFANLITGLGSDTNTVNQMYSTYDAATTAAKNQRDSISAVNTDEELSNMLLYQHAYEAAAKVISTVDSLLQTVINMKQ